MEAVTLFPTFSLYLLVYILMISLSNCYLLITRMSFLLRDYFSFVLCFLCLASTWLETIQPFMKYVLLNLIFIYTVILNNYYSSANNVNSDYEVYETRIIIINLSTPPCKMCYNLTKGNITQFLSEIANIL